MAETIAEPPPPHRAIPMLEVMPPELAAAYGDSRRVFKAEADLPQPFDQLCRRYSRFGGPRSEWTKYLRRPVARELWHFAPACAAAATVSVA